MKMLRTIMASVILVLGMGAFSSTYAINININKADAVTLQKMKGLGPKKAKSIVAYREANGNFKSVDDLAKVKGIGEKSLKRIESKNEDKLSVR